MSGVLLRCPVGQIACVAATAKTVLQIVAAANHRVKIPRITVTFEGAAASDAPAEVKIVKQTTAIGGTPTGVTLYKQGDFGETIQATAAKYGGTPSEPTSTDVYDQDFVPVYQGGRIFLGPYWVPGGGRLGVVVASPVNVDCCVTVDAEE